MLDWKLWDSDIHFLASRMIAVGDESDKTTHGSSIVLLWFCVKSEYATSTTHGSSIVLLWFCVKSEHARKAWFHCCSFRNLWKHGFALVHFHHYWKSSDMSTYVRTYTDLHVTYVQDSQEWPKTSHQRRFRSLEMSLTSLVFHKRRPKQESGHPIHPHHRRTFHENIAAADNDNRTTTTTHPLSVG